MCNIIACSPSIYVDGRIDPPHMKICERRTTMQNYILDDYNEYFEKFGKLAALWILLKIIF